MRSCSAREKVLALEAREPGGERDVRGARALCLERANALDGGRDVDPFPPEKQLARERRAVEVAQRERLHRRHATT